MECSKKLRVKKYLERFEEILCAMEYKMWYAKVNENITKYFIECMIPHHQAAIYMCENLLQYTHFEPLIAIANSIIKEQSTGICQMSDIYNTTNNCCNFEENVNSYTKKYCEIVKAMVYKMKNSPKDININLDFVNEMVPHHEGAIYMCKNVLEYDIDARLKEVALSIIEEQEKGVKELENLRNKLN